MSLLPSDLCDRLTGIRAVAAITGAGISVESGIRAYRGAGGLYDDKKAGDDAIEALSAHTLHADPDRTWRVLAELVTQARGARPNRGHLALARIEAQVSRFILLTQNVDGLHREAGSENLIDIHGDVFQTRCMTCHLHGALPPIPRRFGRVRAPRCDLCGGVLRPAVVLFGESLPADKVWRMERELIAPRHDLMLVVGTTGLFPYVGEPVRVAAQRGSLVVEINPEPTALTALADFHLAAPAGELLPAIAEALAAA